MWVTAAIIVAAVLVGLPVLERAFDAGVEKGVRWLSPRRTRVLFVVGLLVWGAIVVALSGVTVRFGRALDPVTADQHVPVAVWVGAAVVGLLGLVVLTIGFVTAPVRNGQPESIEPGPATVLAGMAITGAGAAALVTVVCSESAYRWRPLWFGAVCAAVLTWRRHELLG